MAAGVTIYDLGDGRACLAYYVEGKRRRETFVSKRMAQQRAREIEALKGKGLKVAPRAQAAGDDTARYCTELLAAAGVDKPLTSVVEEYLAAAKALDREGGTLVEACESLRRVRQEQGTRPVVTVAALREEYRLHLVAMGRDGKYIKKTCDIYLGNFVRAFPSEPLHTLTSADLERWWATISGAGKTRNNYRNAVETFLISPATVTICRVGWPPRRVSSARSKRLTAPRIRLPRRRWPFSLPKPTRSIYPFLCSEALPASARRN